jgi:rhomboid family protein
LVINLVGSVLMPGISLAGHVGGAVGGALLAIVFPVRGERKIYSPSQRGLASLAFIVLSALMLFAGLL